MISRPILSKIHVYPEFKEGKMPREPPLYAHGDRLILPTGGVAGGGVVLPA